MRIDGRNRLACKILIRDLAPGEAANVKIQVEPILGLPVLKDLIVDMEPFFAHYREVMPFFINDESRRTGANASRHRKTAEVRRYDQVYPVRVLHSVLPVVLGQRQVCRPGGDRAGAPLHLRQPRQGRGAAARYPGRAERRVALPHDLQLHAGLPARDRSDARYRRSVAIKKVRQKIIRITVSKRGGEH